MDIRKIIGVLLIAISIILFVIVASQILQYVSLTGISLNAHAEYTPPFFRTMARWWWLAALPGSSFCWLACI